MSLAFVFPGQGSQSIGMLTELAKSYPQVQEVFSEASSVLDYDLWQLVEFGTIEELSQTDKTQPAMLAAGIAVLRCWQEKSGLTPDYYAGHSLGEYTALVASGALDFKEAIKLVEQRGLFMQQAVPVGEGGMAAILGLDDEQVKTVCEEASNLGIIEAVNFNSPGQVVIAGSLNAVEKTISIAKDAGAKRALLLPVSVPSHCALMKPAANKLSTELENIIIQPPSIPVIHNASVTSSINGDEIKELLAQQLYSPVRWVETIELLAQRGVSTIVECGPGKVLAGLTKRIDKSLNALPVFDTSSLDKAITTLGDS
jgi:[acyl-carrier-protein] S-malonyltransferase